MTPRAPIATRVWSRPAALVGRGWLALAAGAGWLVLERFQGKLGFYDDEGMNLIKAFLVARGESLYGEIYSDQAPLYTWLLAAPIRIFDAGYGFAQQIAVLFGVITLVAACAVAAEIGGAWAGAVCAALLLCWAPFLKFGSSVVITIPALGAATWALYWAFRYGATGSRRALLLSGALLGVAASFKLAFLYFLPVIALAVLVLRRGTPANERRRALAWWGLALLAPMAAVVALCPVSVMARQLIEPHLAALATYHEQAARMRWTMLLAPGMGFFYLAAGAALVVLVRLHRRKALVLGAWVLVVAAWILNHRPLWSHHLPDLLVPLAVCAAAGTVASIQILRQRRALVGLVVPLSLALTMSVHLGSYDHWRRFYDNASQPALQQVASALAAVTPEGERVVVDQPILAFWARRRPPPALSLLVIKRVISGELTDDLLVRELDQYRPAGMALCSTVLWRFPRFQQQVLRDYEEVNRIITPLAWSGRQGKQCRVLHRHPPAPARTALDPPARPSCVGAPCTNI